MAKVIKGEFPYGHFFKMVGGKWKPYILIAIDYEGSIRFNAIIRMWEDISPKMLYTHLNELAADGLIRRHEIPDSRQHTEYTLTELGKEVIPILKSIYKFAVDDMIEKDILIDSRTFDFYNPANKPIEKDSSEN